MCVDGDMVVLIQRGARRGDPDTLASGIRHPASGIRHPASGIRHPASGIRHPACGRLCPSGIVCATDAADATGGTRWGKR
ncbi:hypothetical protein CZ774_04150 [Frigoribacterium sp. JB110]|nr:hypothetical protein CZ774_04150 [Frigoribacterium sp. JB110]